MVETEALVSYEYRLCGMVDSSSPHYKYPTIVKITRLVIVFLNYELKMGRLWVSY